MNEIGALKNEQRFRFVGPEWDLIELCGFHVRAMKPEWLADEYDVLVTIQHHYEDEGSTVILPLSSSDGKAISWLAGHLLATQRDKLYGLYSTGFASATCHDEPYIEHLRIAKESAIVGQRWEAAAALRDIERKVMRYASEDRT